jgi:[protein-PII] uridylyltransferase
MSWTAQREDISDPRVIDRFAETVGDQERLDNLYLLTVADIRGTSPKVWNEWKGQLLSNLYASTSRRLRTGLSGAEAIIERIEVRKAAIRKLVAGRVPLPALEKLWSQLGQEYFLRNGPETSAWHAEQINQAGLLDLPLVAARYRDEIKAQQILVLAPESENLLPRITGGLDKLNLNIFDARIHQTRSGLALLVFIAADPDGAPAGEKKIRDNTEKLKHFLLSPPADYRPVSRILSRALKQFRVPTTVTFGETDDHHYTTMEVVAQDRPGLLYHVSLALLECKVKLISAKVSTVGEKAEDTFFITNRDGNPVDSAPMRDCLKQRLERYLAPLGESQEPFSE